MAVHVIRQGLDLPITGAPTQKIEDAPAVARVAILADDYPLMKPRLMVSVGDSVKRGQVLFEDRKAPGVRFTAPGAGTVQAINRGERRALQSVVIALSEAEQSGRPSDDAHEPFAAYAAVKGKSPADLSRDAVAALLAESGLWTALRARPFGRVPSTSETPAAIFVTAIDTHPLAADPAAVLRDAKDDFANGLAVVTRLTEGKTYLCKAAGADIPKGSADVQVEEFAGKHPAGLVGTHIHLLFPVSRSRVVWYLGYQDVVAIGRLFSTGTLDVSRVIALGGPVVKRPRLLRTRLGAATDPLVAGELADGENRVISGSVFGGSAAAGEIHGYLGRYANQLSCLAEDRERVFFGWLRPGLEKFSLVSTYLGGYLPKKLRDFTTSTHGQHRAMVPLGIYERVMPLDIPATFLLRSLVVDDLARAESLGCLELEEEDLALCTFACPGKEDYGVALRRNLTEIWKEG